MYVNQFHHNLKLLDSSRIPYDFYLHYVGTLSRPQEEIEAKLEDGQTNQSAPSFVRPTVMLIMGKLADLLIFRGI